MFAEGYKRNDKGEIIFPRDTELRKSLFFPDAVMAHPAKMNLYAQQAMIEYVSKPGETILDMFGGTGSLMIAATMGRRVILIELEDGYFNIIREGIANLEDAIPEAKGLVTVIQGDNRMILPIPVNHIISSPPYAGAMDIKKVREVKDERSAHFAEIDRQMMEYSKSPRNISKLNTFLYNQNMENIYRLCYQSLPVGGTLTVNIKDRINNGERVYLGKWVEKVCLKAGFKSVEWFSFEAMGTQFTATRRSRGEETVDAEDVIVFRK